MSSFEANTYTAKPPVQIGNSITVTKPIKASNLCIKPQTELHHQFSPQPKKIQPFPKSKPLARDSHHANTLKPKPGNPAVFQLKSLHKSAPPSVNADYGRIDVPKRKATLESVTIKKPHTDSLTNRPIHEIPNIRSGPVPQKRILAVQAKTEFTMGTEQSSPSRMQNPSSAAAPLPETNTASATLNTQQMVHSPSPAHLNTIPVPVATMNASQGLNPRMASIINAQGDLRVGDIRTAQPGQPMGGISSGPRVVSTSSSKTITGGVTSTGPIKQQISHRASGSFGARTAVIQSAPAIRGQQQPIVRSVTPPVRTLATGHRAVNPTLAPAGLCHTQNPNPTTVQITIHQPKQTVSNPTAGGGSDRPIANTHHVSTGHYGNPPTQIPLPVTGTVQQGMQRLVISQSPSGLIQQSRTAAMNSHDLSRIIAGAPNHTSPNLTPLTRKYGRPPNEYSTGLRKPLNADGMPSHSSVSLHTLAESQPPVSTFVPSNPVTCSGGGNFHPTTISNLENQGVFKAHSYHIPPSHISTSCRPGSVGPPTVVMGDSSSQDSTTFSNTLLARPGISPSILRKRAHDSSNPVVVKKISPPGGDRLSGYSGDRNSSQPTSPARHPAATTTSLEKDTGSQSSTDTAMSSESPNHPVVKSEPVDAIENGGLDPQPPDVSPRKKPRKQLLNTAAQLKDRHDSSTEEETETKTEQTTLPMPEGFKLEFDDEQRPSIKDDFVDREGVRWVKMRPRHSDPLLCFYNCSWKSRNNHFQRHADVKVKEERRPVVSELSNQKGIQQKASGWKFYHLSAQIQEMIDIEHALRDRMGRLQKLLPSKSKDRTPELCKINELAQANKQRCSLTKDQLLEAKSSMFSLLDTHKPKILEIIQKNHSKRPVKKKERS